MTYQPDLKERIARIDFEKANASTVGGLTTRLNAIAKAVEEAKPAEARD